MRVGYCRHRCEQAGRQWTTLRNTSSPHWRRWLEPETDAWFRSIASLSMPVPNSETKKDVVWFVLNDDRRLTAF